MWNSLIDTGDPAIEILLAHVEREDLRAKLALSGTDPDRAEIRVRLDTFYRRAAASDSPEATASPPPWRRGGPRSRPPSSPAGGLPADLRGQASGEL